MPSAKKILIAGIIFIGAFAFYVAPVFADTSAAPKQTKSYCWQKTDCEKSKGTFSSSVKTGDCLPSYGYCYPKEEDVNLQIPIGSLKNTGSLGQYIPALYNYMIAIVSIVAIVMIMIGGLQYLTAGSSGRIGQAKERIVGAVIGLIIALSAYTILQTVNPATLQFATSLKIKMVAPQWAAQWCPNTTLKGTDYTGEFECGNKYGPNETKTVSKSGKTVPLTSGYCNGSACKKDKNNNQLDCIKLTYKGTDTPSCQRKETAKICEIAKQKANLCSSQSSYDPTTATCASSIIILRSSLDEQGLKVIDRLGIWQFLKLLPGMDKWKTDAGFYVNTDKSWVMNMCLPTFGELGCQPNGELVDTLCSITSLYPSEAKPTNPLQKFFISLYDSVAGY